MSCMQRGKHRHRSEVRSKMEIVLLTTNTSTRLTGEYWLRLKLNCYFSLLLKSSTSSSSNVSVSIPVPWSHSVIGLFIKLIRSPSPVNKLSLSFYTSLPAQNIEIWNIVELKPTNQPIYQFVSAVLMLHPSNCHPKWDKIHLSESCWHQQPLCQ